MMSDFDTPDPIEPIDPNLDPFELLTRLVNELKSPLNTLQGMSQLLLDERLTEETRREYLTRIHAGVLGLQEIRQMVKDYIEAKSPGSTD